ncbi:MAG: N-6 DNA methylase [Campylobacterales bacterium]|nr:N-6 DNA methylase [Campylobacterales bacterium]
MKPLDIFKDKEFQSLPLEQKQTIAQNFFDKESADEEFLKLDVKQQKEIKSNFVNAQIEFDISDTRDKLVNAFIPTPAAIATEVSPTLADPGIHDSPIAPNRDGTMPKPAPAPTPEPFSYAPDNTLVQSDDSTATRAFAFDEKTGKALSPAEQDIQIGTENAQILTGDGSEFVSKTAPSGNAMAGMVNRSNELLGNSLKFVQHFEDEAVGIDSDHNTQFFGDLANWITKDKLDKKDVHTADQVKAAFKAGGLFDVDTWLEALYFGAEQGPQSVADMGHMVLQLPAYIASRSYEMADTRAKNDGRKKATTQDIAITLPLATGSALLDKLGLKAMTSDIVTTVGKSAMDAPIKETLKIIGAAVGKGAIKETATEIVQEGGLEYVAEQAGTEKGATFDEGLERGLWGGLAGFVMGGAMSTATATGSEVTKAYTQTKKEQLRDAHIQDAYNKQMMGSGLVLNIDDAAFTSFKAEHESRIKTIQDEFANLAINHPDKAIPADAIENVTLQEQVVAEAKAEGLNVSDNNGLNAIDAGFAELEQEIGSAEPLKPKAAEPTLIELPVTVNDLGQKVTYSTNANKSRIITTEIYDGFNIEKHFSESQSGIYQKAKSIKEGKTASQSDFTLNQEGDFVPASDILVITSINGKASEIPAGQLSFVGTKEQREQIVSLLVEKETANLDRALIIDNEIKNIVNPSEAPIIEKPIIGQPEPEAKQDTARLTELQAKTEDELTIDERFELEDLQAQTSVPAQPATAAIATPVIGQPKSEARLGVTDINVGDIEAPPLKQFTMQVDIPEIDLKKGDLVQYDGSSADKFRFITPDGTKAFVKVPLSRTEDEITQKYFGISAKDFNNEVKLEAEAVVKENLTTDVTDINTAASSNIANTKPLSQRAQAIREAAEIPIGGSEDAAAEAVKQIFNQKDPDSEYKKLSANDIAAIDEQHEISRGQSFSATEYSRAYDFMPTEKKKTPGVQNGFAFEGTQNALFDMPAGEEYTVPTWAKDLVSNTTRYEDVITALTNAKNGEYSVLSTRAMDALAKAGSPHLSNEIKRYNEMSENFFDLNEIEDQEFEALTELLKTYLDGEENGTNPRDTATATTETATVSQSSKGSQDPVQEVSGTGTYTAGSQSPDAGSIPANVKIVFDVNKVYSTDGIMHEYPTKTVGKRIQKDVAKYVQQLSKALGGWEVATDKKGKVLPFMGVSDNLAPAGGSVSFKLFKPNTDIGVYVSIDIAQSEDKNGKDTYSFSDRWGSGELYRLTYRNKSNDGQNRWVKNENLTSQEFVRDIMSMVEREAATLDAKAEENKKDETRGTTARGAAADRADNTAGVPAQEQGTPDTGPVEGSDSAVRNGDQRLDGPGAPGVDQAGVSAGYEPVGGHQTAGGNNAPEQGTRTDGDAVLPKPDERHSPEAYSLEGKAPVELTKGERKKFNAAALEILKKPLEEITEADREVLRHYTGEGGLGEVNENTVNQHYTSYETVQSIYSALKQADVPMNKVLEPAVGSGNFVGFMPGAQWDVVDIDTTNVEVVKRLYPQINTFVNDTYETFQGKNYDLIVSNVPFASEQMLMREHAMTIKPAFKAIHNFYFAHSIDKAKDNGVVAFMTSTGTMEGTTTARSLRKYLMDRGDIIGAFRLPEKSQAKNAHTDTMIDIIFIQKRPAGVKSRQEATNNQFVNIANKDGQPMNEYFIAHPENLLGDTVVIEKDKMKMGREGWVVKGEPHFEKIKISYEPYKALPKAKADQSKFESMLDAVKYAKENGIEFKVADKPQMDIGENSIRYFDTLIAFTDTEAVAMFGKELRGDNAQKTLLLNRIMRLTEEGIANEDKGLMASALREIEAYKETYVKSPHNDLAYKRFMKEHRAELKLKEFMSYFDKDFNPAAVYEQQTRFKDSGKLSISADSPVIEKAVYYADADGVLSTERAYELLSAKEIETLEANRDFVRSDSNALQLDFLYYAGNVYAKLDALEILKASGEIDAAHYKEQSAKLKAITPALIPFKNITVRGNESWLPDAVKEKLVEINKGELFIIKKVFGGHGDKVEIYNRYLNKKTLAPKGKDESDAENITRTMEVGRLLNETLIPMVMNYIESQGLSEILTDGYNRHSNFYVRPEMSGRLLRELPKSFRGKAFKMQGHQLQGAEKIVYNKKGVLAFAPGGGKTITAIVAVMNLIEQGVMKKPLFVVPVNTIAQWEASVRELYPDATVYEFPKIQSGKNKGNAKEWTQLSREEKEQMAYDLANNRYDFTIIGDTMFQKFGLPSGVLSEYVDDLVEQIQSEEEAEEGGKKGKKDQISAEAKKRALKRGLKQAYGGEVEFDFAKLGFDGLIADEVQYYKNIGFAGKDAKGGLGTSIAMKYFDKEGKSLTSKEIKGGEEPYSATLGSMRSYDFRFKSKYVSQNNNGNNVILLTGTPTPNAPLELYTLLQHLDENILLEYGISTSSDFVDTFYDVESYETTDSTGAIVKRDGLAQMKNLDWMGKILDRFVDYRGFNDMPDLPRPKQVDVKHYLKLSKAGEVVFQDVQHRLLTAIEDGKKVKAGNMLPEEAEIPLVAMGAGRSASIDLRLYDVGKKGKSALDTDSLYDLIENDIAGTENNKILKTIDLVSKQYKENTNSGQIIFLDRLTVKNRDGSETSTHKEMREKILATGLFDENEVVFVNGASFVNPLTGKISNSSIKPDMLNRIMDMYNAGTIKVIIGNTSKLGVGVDLNRKTTDIYQLDIPYRPDEIEQRSNRGVRQGNENPEVRVHQFFQLGTFDKRSYQIVMNKRGFNDMYGFSDNTDLIVEDGVSKIDNSSTTDPYQAVIDLESNPFERERLRKQRVIDNSATDEINIKRLISNLELDIRTKQSSNKNYDDAIKNIDEQLSPANYPKYESIKDASERKEKLAKHIEGLKERKAKYQGNIAENETIIKGVEEKLNERKDQLAQQAADKKFITDEFTTDGKNVSITKIKAAFTVEQILKSEGATKQEIAQYMMQAAEPQAETANSYMKAPTPKQLKQIEETNHYARLSGYDEAGANYIPNYAIVGAPHRPQSDNIQIGNRTVALPPKDKPINADSLRVYLSDIIGNRLYDGKIKGRSALGVYQRKSTAIRVKNYSDIEVMAHEMAHFLDFFHNNTSKKAEGSFFRKEILKNKEEIKALSYTTEPKHVISEGFAEFVRLWLTNYNAVALVAPGMVKDFEARLAKDRKLQLKIEVLQDGMHKFYFQGPLASLRGKRGGELDSIAKKINRSQAEIGKDIRQSAIDKIHSVKRIEAAIRGDVAPDAIDSAYKTLQLVNGSASIMHTAMNIGVPTVLDNGDLSYSGKPLNEIFAPATKISVERVMLLEDFFVAKRASELKAQGRENLITAQEIEAGLALSKTYPEFETIFNEYQEFNNAMLDFYVGMKLITSDQRENFKEMNKNYVPFHRITESIMDGKVSPAKIGQRLTGGTHSLNNIMENIVNGIESNIKQALISRGKSVLYTMLEESGQGGVYATRVGAENKLVKSDLAQQAKKVAQLMMELGVTVSKDGLILSGNISSENIIDVAEIEDNLLANPSALEFWTHGHKPTSTTAYIDTAIIDGKKVYFEVHDVGLVEALTSFSGVNYNSVVQGLMSAKNIITWNITNNPLFYLTNFTRDTVSASVLSKNNFIPVMSSITGMYHFTMNTKTYKEFMASGAGYGTRSRSLGGETDVMGMLEVNRGLEIMSKVISAMESGADRFEYGTRIGEFALAKKAGKSNMQAGFEGREISTDFAIKGSNQSLTSAMATVPFMKAAINGMDKTARRIFSLNGEMKLGNAAKFRNQMGELQTQKIKFYAYGAIIAGFTLALWFNNKDDERWKKLSKDQKQMNWFLFIPGSDKPIKIPRPFDIGFAFATVPEIMADAIYTEKGEDALKDFVWGLKAMFNVGDIPGLFQPVGEHLTNEKWTGAPLVPPSLQNLDDLSDQYDTSTPILYRKFGKATGASPILTQHYVDGLLGLTAKMIEENTEKMLWDTDAWGARPFEQNVLEFITYRFRGKEQPTHTIYSEKYYKLAQKAAGVKASLTLKKKKAFLDNGKDISEYAAKEEKGAYKKVDDLMSRYNKTLTNIKNGVEFITYDKTLSKAEKEKQINAAYAARTDMFKEITGSLETELKKLEEK